MKKRDMNMKEKIYNFFEHPKGFAAVAFQVMIFILIIASVGIAFLEFFEHKTIVSYKEQLDLFNHIILVIFTVEYVLRLATSPKKLRFVVKPMNIVDFLAIFPNYVELLLPVFIDTTELRVLRVIRLLRFARVLRAFKLFHYGKFFRKAFRFQETILEAIFPVLIMFLLLKGLIWGLEAVGFWIPNADLGNLFAIIGFALGIILSQKIGVSYDKFVNVEEATIRLYSNVRTLAAALDNKRHGLGTKALREWTKTFLSLLENPVKNNLAIGEADMKLYKILGKRFDETLIGLFTNISQDGAFCLSKKNRLTPKAYDTLLHQSTVLYLALICVFIPGITGIISILTATYILYGMYHLTQDLDSIIGGEFNLINIDISELTSFVES